MGLVLEGIRKCEIFEILNLINYIIVWHVGTCITCIESVIKI